ncbi:choice-of-anchor L domain-containing protein, partial [Myroides guanonis]
MKIALVKKGLALFVIFLASIFLMYGSQKIAFMDKASAEISTITSAFESILFAAPDNDDCSSALELSINPTLTCVAMTQATFVGATLSTQVKPACAGAMTKDIWFEFTATATSHRISMEDFGAITFTAYVAVYDKTCGAMTSATKECFTLSNSNTGKQKVLEKLVIGRKYYVRIGVAGTAEFAFKVCLATIPPPLKVSPSGEMYSVEGLVKDVLVKSGCNLVSNVTYQVGDGSAKTKSVNTFGYFNKNGSDFPFEEGVVLSTSEVQFVPGPYRNGDKGTNTNRWLGDKDLNDAIADAGGGISADMRVTQVEFDFIPVKDSLQFEYLFTSNSYDISCGNAGCNNGAMFAAWLIDTTTGIGGNLAKVPGTNKPIALNTIRNATMSGKTCTNENEKYYWKHYSNNQSDPLEASINFVGLTTGLQSLNSKVVPGRKYHIKLAVLDFCTTPDHTSAVFFNARSFDIGTPSLGDNLVIEGGSALCPGETMVLKADLNPNDYVIQWTKDGMDLVGENGPTLTISSKGLYGVNLDYKNVACYLVVDPIQVEYYDEIIIEKPPLNLVQCKSPTATTLFNLESSMKGVTHYPVTAMFYESKSDAENDTGQIPSYYNFDNTFSSKTIWVRIQSAISPCFKVYSFTIKTETCVIGLVPLNDMHICNTPGSTFDLSQYDSIVYHGAAGYTVEYFISNTDAIARL